MTSVLEEKREPSPPVRPRNPLGSGLIVPLLAAFQFLTVAPALVRRPFTPRELGRAVGFFPLVGAALGGLLFGLSWVLEDWFPPYVTAALVLVVWVLATGALHLDGFLDTCDGLFGGRTPENRLRIMRDERVGAFAVIGGVLLLLVKFVALAAVLGRKGALLLAPVLARWGMVLAMVAFPYARPEGLGRTMKDNVGWGELALATLLTGLAIGLADPWRGGIALALGGAAILVGAWFVLRRLPGLTGDIYGAMGEVLEVLVLLVFVAGGAHAA